jgi:hypothetical protein
MTFKASWHMKGGIVESEETEVTKQRIDKHLSAATDSHKTIEELLEIMFVPRLQTDRSMERWVDR